MLAVLDKEVGEGQYLLCLTADHGVCPLPEASKKQGKDAGRFPAVKVLRAAEKHLKATFDPHGKHASADWLEEFQGLWAYLNQKLIAEAGLKSADVEKELAAYLAKQEGVGRTFVRADFAKEFPDDDAVGRRMKKAYFAERSGDVGVLLKEYWLPGGRLTGTGHGTPYGYDTHVPLMVFGPGVKPGKRTEDVVPQAIAAIMCESLGIKPPAKAEYGVPEGLFGK